MGAWQVLWSCRDPLNGVAPRVRLLWPSAALVGLELFQGCVGVTGSKWSPTNGPPNGQGMLCNSVPYCSWSQGMLCNSVPYCSWSQGMLCNSVPYCSWSLGMLCNSVPYCSWSLGMLCNSVPYCSWSLGLLLASGRWLRVPHNSCLSADMIVTLCSVKHLAMPEGFFPGQETQTPLRLVD
jgi:hypothetical protein